MPYLCPFMFKGCFMPIFFYLTAHLNAEILEICVTSFMNAPFILMVVGCIMLFFIRIHAMNFYTFHYYSMNDVTQQG